MKKLLAVAAVASGLLVVAARAQDGAEIAAAPPASEPDWSAWTRPLISGVPPRAPLDAGAPPQLASQQPVADADAIDVVDAHWMALTMWGEARGEGEEGMRAVGHVIRNRWLAERYGAYVTDTVSQAYQFSCWNEGDPNRAAMLRVDELPADSDGHRQWQAAKRLANEILAGHSSDPTGGALFYHTNAVQPAWSRGVTPVARIGDHLFFRTAV
ncbi:cell wall hydrolase [Sphingosinicella sp. LY1275]|uniref:cell wall hydrolase n=1 Tax=Sphingosinicella sp. LY1275 TaxID=3095379 RepID=UPI002ADEC0AD|nr:cell wall hydrolase [Sphingosinicella sp. LY1275]MEA1013079.1 cell wall hydrolase [Sphingosinicella sp. LY1275]